MKNSYVLINKPSEVMLFKDIFEDCQKGGKYSKTIIDAMKNLTKTGKTQFWNGVGNQFLYIALTYMGVGVVCDRNIYYFDKKTKFWGKQQFLDKINPIPIEQLNIIEMSKHRYNFKVVSNTIMDNKKYEIVDITKNTCPVIEYVEKHNAYKKRKNNTVIKYINNQKSKQTKVNTKNDVVR